ncbi:MAG: nucleotidyltransferase domain-containing protein [Magnetococcales bacterium]|nr:nucleotidyltransferase domain-containing protein [Magnetococcales bacterium]
MCDPSLLDLSPRHLAIVQGILRRRIPGREVRVFGSRARHTAGERSDLDLVILGDHPLPLGVFADLQDDFSASDLPFKVDIVEWSDMTESFRAVVARGWLALPEG